MLYIHISSHEDATPSYHVRLNSHYKFLLKVGWVEATKPNAHNLFVGFNYRSTQPTFMMGVQPDLISILSN